MTPLLSGRVHDAIILITIFVCKGEAPKALLRRTIARIWILRALCSMLAAVPTSTRVRRQPFQLVYQCCRQRRCPRLRRHSQLLRHRQCPSRYLRRHLMKLQCVRKKRAQSWGCSKISPAVMMACVAEARILGWKPDAVVLSHGSKRGIFAKESGLGYARKKSC